MICLNCEHSFPAVRYGLCRGEDEAEHLGTLILAVMDLQEEDVDAVLKVFRSCHNSRVGHFGGRRTYRRRADIIVHIAFLNALLVVLITA